MYQQQPLVIIPARNVLYIPCGIEADLYPSLFSVNRFMYRSMYAMMKLRKGKKERKKEEKRRRGGKPKP